MNKRNILYHGNATLEIITISPKLAAEMLKSNVVNRSPKRVALRYLIEEIKFGSFVLNWQSIIFTTEGHLINGQHRLMACVETNIDIECLVVRGADKSIMKTLDTGSLRSLSDIFQSRKIKNYALNASIVKYIHIFDSKSEYTYVGKQKLAQSKLLQLFDEKEAEIGLVCKKVVNTPQNLIKIPSSILGICFFLFRQIDKESAENFMTNVMTGVKLGNEDVELKLRMDLFAAYDARVQGARRPRQFSVRIIDIIIRAWNTYRNPGLIFNSKIKYTVNTFSDITDAI